MRLSIMSALRRWRGAALAVALTAIAVSVVPPAASASPRQYLQWPMFGQNFANTASGLTFSINTDNVHALTPKWTFTTGGDISARAAVVDHVAYFPDWSGNVYAVNTANGNLIWAKNILTDFFPAGVPDHAGVTKVVSRTSPAVDGDTLYLGTQTGAYLLAIDTGNGSLKWKTQLDTHPLAVATQSPVIYRGVVYLGVASLEEGAAANPNYPCCSFQGSMQALNAATGTVIWKTYATSGTSVPADPALGYTGNSIWGSTAVVDPERNQVYFTTGNNYKDPTGCPTVLQPGCLSPNDHVDSVLALDLSSGAIKWAQRLSSGDDWNVSCFSAGINCPASAGPDYDFGSGVNMFFIPTRHGLRTIIGAGQKSGVYSAFDPDTGQILWATQVGPGSALGGIEWGSATDGRRIYVAIGNLNHTAYTLQPSGLPTSAGSWSALDPATGKILWQTADPNGAIDLGPMTVANGVVYAPSMAGSPNSQNMFALNAASGSQLWSYTAGGSVVAGAVVVNDTVYWGSGYSNLPVPGFVGNNKFYAFSLRDQ